MSRRLTNDDRKVIRERLIDHAFSKREAALLKESNILGMQAHERIYPKKLRDAMAALPEGFLYTDDDVCVNVGGKRVEIKLSARVRVRQGHTSAPDRSLSVLDDDAFGAKVLAHARAVESLRDEKSRAERDIRLALLSMATVKQCIERWPEARVFVEDLEKKPSTALAIPLRDLNKTLGLPPA